MTTCVIVALLVSCQIDRSTRLTPAQAAALLAPRQFVALADTSGGPRVTVLSFSAPAVPVWPTTRLDGSSLSQPPIVYGVPYPYTPFQYALLNGGHK